MPIYMDRHDLDGVTAKDVAEAHREDLNIQHKYDCKGLTYWFDEKRGTAFCLIEAPNAECVKNMHDDAHGLVPHQIIEVESNVVSAFLGRIEDPKSDKHLDDANLPIIEESAFRIIMYVCLKDALLLKLNLEKEKAMQVINSGRDIIQKSMKQYGGHEVKKDRKRIVVSFISAASAVMCALDIQNQIRSNNRESFNLRVKISLSAGVPVTGQHQLFGETLQLAERLCEVANQESIIVSSEVNNVYSDEIFDGLSEDTPVQILSADDEKFINKLSETTDLICNDPQFDVGHFGQQVGLSRSQFYRKVSNITGLSPNGFIMEFRLAMALSLIEKQQGTIGQIAFESGFNSPSYFSKCFQKRFGILPSNLVSQSV